MTWLHVRVLLATGQCPHIERFTPDLVELQREYRRLEQEISGNFMGSVRVKCTQGHTGAFLKFSVALTGK